MNFDQIEKLVEIMKKNGLAELKVDSEAGKVSLRAFEMGATPMMAAPSFYPPPTHQPQAVAAPAEGAAAADDAAAKAAAIPPGKLIKSPFVGTFYRASQPGADPFCEVGARIKKGDVLCIVEAMKLMNEIEAETDGVIREILVENGEPVEFDQPLFVLE